MIKKYKGFQIVWWIVLLQAACMLIGSLAIELLLKDKLPENVRMVMSQLVIIIPIIVGIVILKRTHCYCKVSGTMGFRGFSPTVMLIIAFLPLMTTCFVSFAAAPATVALSELFGEYDAGVVAPNNLTDFFMLFLMLSIIAPIFEETLFRGIIMSLLEPYGSFVSITISAVAFSMLHFQPVAFLPILGLGVVLALIRNYTGSIYPCILFHSLSNFYSLLTLVFSGSISRDSMWIIVATIVLANLFPIFIFMLYKLYGQKKWYYGSSNLKIGGSVALIITIVLYFGISGMTLNPDIFKIDIKKIEPDNLFEDKYEDSFDDFENYFGDDFEDKFEDFFEQ